MIFRILFSASLIILMVNVGEIFSIGFANAIEKFFILLAGVALWYKRHFDQRVVAVLSVVLILTLSSAIFTSYAEFEWIVYLKSLFQIITIYAFISARLTEGESRSVLFFVSWLPVISVAFGIFYWILLGRGVFSFEYVSSLPRLQGSLIAAYLGAYCIASCYSALRFAESYDIRYLWLFGVNVIVLVLTGGRMALLIGFLLSVPVFIVGFKEYSRIKKMFFWGLVVSFMVVMAVAGDVIIGRLFQGHLSGRELIWEYLAIVLEEYWWFGVGYGHQVTLLPHEVKVLVGGTISAHNEYLRIAVEIGFIQMVVFFLCLSLAIFLRVYANSCKNPIEVLWAFVLYLIICLTENSVSSVSGFLFLVVVVMTRNTPIDMEYHKIVALDKK